MQRNVDVQGCTNIVVAGCKRAWNNEITEYSIFSITYRTIVRSTDESRFKAGSADAHKPVKTRD